MNKLNYIGLVFCLLLAGLSQKAFSQQSGQLGHFDNLPQVTWANPALRPNSKVNVGFPGLSNLYTNHNNNWFVTDDVLSVDGTTATLDAESILSNIDEFARLNQGISNELLHVGIEFEKHYFHLRVAERTQVDLTIPEDVFNFAVYGNTGNYAFDNNTMDFSDLGVEGIHFREYSLGYNINWNEQWSFGATAKYLYGMERVSTSNSDLSVRTNPETFALQTSGSYEVNTSGIDRASDGDEGITEDVQNYIFGLDNRGFGFDLGAVYRLNDKLEFQVSANDVGYITWKSDVANYRTEDATFLFDGVDMTEFIFLEGDDFDDALEDEIDATLDELESIFGTEDPSEDEFNTGINGFMRYAASYSIYESSNTSGKAWATVFHGLGASTVPFSASVGYNQRVGRFLQAGAHVSKSARAPFALGGGISVNAGFFQIYCLVENLRMTQFTSVTQVDADDPTNRTELFYFSNPQDIRLHFGINLTFGRKPFGSIDTAPLINE